jgi:hypothetical protein
MLGAGLAAFLNLAILMRSSQRLNDCLSALECGIRWCSTFCRGPEFGPIFDKLSAMRTRVVRDSALESHKALLQSAMPIPATRRPKTAPLPTNVEAQVSFIESTRPKALHAQRELKAPSRAARRLKDAGEFASRPSTAATWAALSRPSTSHARSRPLTAASSSSSWFG